MSQPTETQLHKQQFFLQAADAYEEAALAYASEQEEVAKVRESLRSVRDRMEDLEAEALVNGGLGAQYIDANSAEKRKAQLRLALSKSPEYQDARKAAIKLERELAQAETRRDAAANCMSVNKRRLDAHVVNVERQSALLNHSGTEVRNAREYAGARQ